MICWLDFLPAWVRFYVLMPFPSHDYSNRDGKLPAGCKDLADAIKHEEESDLHRADPPITRQVFLPGKVSVKYLAEITLTSIYTIAALAMVDINRSIAFEAAARILLKYGIEAKREP